MFPIFLYPGNCEAADPHKDVKYEAVVSEGKIKMESGCFSPLAKEYYIPSVKVD